ncbi:hypothetical protein BLOT_015077 [Blomia tropicalis]|nr:hypothetical protein BLOT_015077 [Blomia tropicalis]
MATSENYPHRWDLTQTNPTLKLMFNHLDVIGGVLVFCFFLGACVWWYERKATDVKKNGSEGKSSSRKKTGVSKSKKSRRQTKSSNKSKGVNLKRLLD